MENLNSNSCSIGSRDASMGVLLHPSSTSGFTGETGQMGRQQSVQYLPHPLRSAGVVCYPNPAGTDTMRQQQGGQLQHADLCSAVSQSRINTPESTDNRRRTRKREPTKRDVESLQAEFGQQFLIKENAAQKVQIDELRKKCQVQIDEFKRSKQQHLGIGGILSPFPQDYEILQKELDELKKKKLELEKKYEKQSKKKQEMESRLEASEAVVKSQRKQLETQEKEIDVLKGKVVELEKKYADESERNQQLICDLEKERVEHTKVIWDLEKEKAEHKIVMDKYVALLEKSNQYVNPTRFETPANDDQQRSLSVSVCGSVTGKPAKHSRLRNGFGHTC